MSYSNLGGNQILKSSYDADAGALRVRDLAASGLVNVAYDEIDLTYVASGNGAGQIETVIYKSAGTQVAMLTLSYDASNNLIKVQKS